MSLDEPPLHPPAERGFHWLEVAAVARETADSVSIELHVPQPLQPIFHPTAGQHLTLRTVLNGEDLRRSYSICSAPGEWPLRLGIKAIPGGRFSGWVLADLKRGMHIEAMPPTGRFGWPFSSETACRYALFAAGSGITPILAILKQGLATEPRSRFTLVYGNRASETTMFLEDICALKNLHMDRLDIIHLMTAELEDCDIRNGRIDAAKMADLVPLIPPHTLSAAFVCGPASMMDAVETALISAGMPAERVLSERFTATAAPAAADAVVAPVTARIDIRLDGVRRRIDPANATGSILDMARAAGLPAPYACKAGVCATCRARVASGSVQMLSNQSLSQAEVAQGFILTCQAFPTGEDVFVDYDG